jgi:hypothetical protein
MSDSLIAHIFLIIFALALIISGIFDRLRLRGNFLTKEDKLLLDKVVDLLKTPKSEWYKKNGFFMHPSDEMGFKYWYEDDPYVKAGDSYAYVYDLISVDNGQRARFIIRDAVAEWERRDKESAKQKAIDNIRFHQV